MKTKMLQVGQQITLKDVPKGFRHGRIVEIKNGMALFSPNTLGYMPFWFRFKVA